MKPLSFFLGLFVGANLGILVACLLSATKIKRLDDARLALESIVKKLSGKENER